LHSSSQGPNKLSYFASSALSTTLKAPVFHQYLVEMPVPNICERLVRNLELCMGFCEDVYNHEIKRCAA
jgi:hypothetical protein